MKRMYKDHYPTFWDYISNKGWGTELSLIDGKTPISVFKPKGIRCASSLFVQAYGKKAYIKAELKYWTKRLFRKKVGWEIRFHDHFIGTRKL